VKVIDAIARILTTEGALILSAHPTTPLIEAAAKADIRPVLCRRERVGVGITKGYAPVINGTKLAGVGMTALDFETAARCDWLRTHTEGGLT